MIQIWIQCYIEMPADINDMRHISIMCLPFEVAYLSEKYGGFGSNHLFPCFCRSEWTFHPARRGTILFGGIWPGRRDSLGEGVDGIGGESLGKSGDKGPDDGLGGIQIARRRGQGQQGLQGDIGVLHVLELGKQVATTSLRGTNVI